MTGTSSAEGGEERTGDGESPATRADVKIILEPPIQRVGKTQVEWAVNRTLQR